LVLLVKNNKHKKCNLFILLNQNKELLILKNNIDKKQEHFIVHERKNGNIFVLKIDTNDKENYQNYKKENNNNIIASFKEKQSKENSNPFCTDLFVMDQFPDIEEILLIKDISINDEHQDIKKEENIIDNVIKNERISGFKFIYCQNGSNNDVPHNNQKIKNNKKEYQNNTKAWKWIINATGNHRII